MVITAHPHHTPKGIINLLNANILYLTYLGSNKIDLLSVRFNLVSFLILKMTQINKCSSSLHSNCSLLLSLLSERENSQIGYEDGTSYGMGYRDRMGVIREEVHGGSKHRRCVLRIKSGPEQIESS